MHTPLRRLSLLIALLGLSCSRTPTDEGPQGGDMMSPAELRCSADLPCPPGRRCYKEACIPDLGPCCSDNDCQNDSRCAPLAGDRDGGACGYCVPFGPGESDAMCQGERFSASEFKPPVERCRWPLGGTNPTNRYVIVAPLVIDLDGDGQPEIVFAAQRDNGTSPASLVAIRGKDCTQIYEAQVSLQPYAQLAAADLDGDRRPEIIALEFNGGGKTVRVFAGLTGALLGSSTEPYALTLGGFNCSGPAVADLDGDGRPEVVIAGMALRWDRANKALVKIWSQPATGSLYGALSTIADMDGDGKPEVITGHRIYDGLTGADESPAALKALADGYYPAIADFNKDGAPDLVLVNRGTLRIVDVKNDRLLLDLSGIDVGGPPTVADFDGDGTPDVGSAGIAAYSVFSLDCMNMPRPAKCKGAGILWQARIKDGSGSTASSVFDFNGDGKAEVVYRDECWLRVYNGPDGKVVFAAAATSATGVEMPVVADVDNDGHADLLVPSDKFLAPTYCADQDPEPATGTRHGGQTEGLQILRDPMNRWMPSRGMWNQHSYHITNINDDGTVPAKEAPNWTSYNNFRQNVQGKQSSSGLVGDLTSRGELSPDVGNCTTQWRLHARICNRGSAAVPPMVPGTFYRMDPRAGAATAICTARTTMSLAPGACEAVSCAWMNPPQSAVDLWFRPGDDGAGARFSPQCKAGNDMAILPGARCAVIPG